VICIHTSAMEAFEGVVDLRVMMKLMCERR
jgi:hypothetical protein